MKDTENPLTNFIRSMVGGYPIGEAIIIKDSHGEPEVVAFVADGELDAVKITFHSEGEIKVHTKGYNYLSLTYDLLQSIADLSLDAIELLDVLDGCWDSEQEAYLGWEAFETRADKHPAPAHT